MLAFSRIITRTITVVSVTNLTLKRVVRGSCTANIGSALVEVTCSLFSGGVVTLVAVGEHGGCEQGCTLLIRVIRITVVLRGIA